MKLILKSIIALGLVLLLATQARAQSPEASVSADQIQQSIQDRIRRAIQENLNSPQTANQPRLKAFIGKVESLTENTLSVLTLNGQGQNTSKQVITREDTVVVKTGKGKAEFASIGLGDEVVAMGITSDLVTMTAIRIVVAAPAKAITTFTQIVNGTISEFNPRSRTMILDTANTQLVGQDIIVSRRAQILDADLEPLALSDLEASQNVVAIVETDTEEETNITYKLMVFPAGVSPTPSQTVTSCGDNVCQEIVCQGVGCPTPETTENCPADCKAKP